MDVPSNGFECVTYPNTRFFLPFEKGDSLKCISPPDLEDMLKACKQGKILPVTECSLRSAEAKWECLTPQGSSYLMNLQDGDGMFCLSPQDLKRISERCQIF